MACELKCTITTKDTLKTTIYGAGLIDSTALHKATNAEISAMTEKETPITQDLLVIEDSENSNSKKKILIYKLPVSSFQQIALDLKLNIANNLSDVLSQQTALNNLTAVSGGGSEHVLTKDTLSGNAIWKAGGSGTSYWTRTGTILTPTTSGDSIDDIAFVDLNDDVLIKQNGSNFLYNDSSQNFKLGIGAGEDLVGGSQNFLLGPGAGGDLTTAYFNTITGVNAVRYAKTPWNITAYGNRVCEQTLDSDITAIGASCLQNGQYTNGSTAVGKEAGQNATGKRLLLFGQKAGSTETSDDKLHISNTGSWSLIEGSLASATTGWLKVQGDLQVNDNTTTRTVVARDGTITAHNLLNAPQNTTAPIVGITGGSIYYNTTTNKLQCYNGTIWNDLF